MQDKQSWTPGRARRLSAPGRDQSGVLTRQTRSAESGPQWTRPSRVWHQERMQLSPRVPPSSLDRPTARAGRFCIHGSVSFRESGQRHQLESAEEGAHRAESSEAPDAVLRHPRGGGQRGGPARGSSSTREAGEAPVPVPPGLQHQECCCPCGRPQPWPRWRTRMREQIPLSPHVPSCHLLEFLVWNKQLRPPMVRLPFVMVRVFLTEGHRQVTPASTWGAARGLGPGWLLWGWEVGC